VLKRLPPQHRYFPGAHQFPDAEKA